MKPHAAEHGGSSPKLLFGAVRHHRLRPARNAFRYGVFTLRLPLRTLAAQGGDWGNRWFSHNRFNLLSFYDADYGEPGPHTAASATPLAWIDALLRREGIADATGEIWLQTFPRVLGYVFNPVNFWFCERADGALRAVLCEVRNTFGQRHCYLLDSENGLANGAPLAARKLFHVSPFCDVEGHYDFRFMTIAARNGAPLRTIARIDYHDAQGPLLLTSVSGSARALNARNTLYAFFRFPLMTFAVIARIHWQALKLWLKRVRFRHLPALPEQQVTHAVPREP